MTVVSGPVTADGPVEGGSRLSHIVQVTAADGDPVEPQRTAR